MSVVTKTSQFPQFYEAISHIVNYAFWFCFAPFKFLGPIAQHDFMTLQKKLLKCSEWVWVGWHTPWAPTS